MKQNPSFIKILLTISIIMLLLCIITRLPRGYYAALRLTIFITSGLLVIAAYKFKKIEWAVTTGLIALLFNPLFPVYLNRVIWKFIDLIVAILFILLLFKPPQRYTK